MRYYCDRHQSLGENIALSLWEYIRNWILRRGRYCNGCWNWIRLAKGSCKICGSSRTLRSENNKVIIECCSQQMELQR